MSEWGVWWSRTATDTTASRLCAFIIVNTFSATSITIVLMMQLLYALFLQLLLHLVVPLPHTINALATGSTTENRDDSISLQLLLVLIKQLLTTNKSTMVTSASYLHNRITIQSV